MNSRRNFDSENEFKDTNYDDSSSDELNKYMNLGLGLNSQELICEFHENISTDEFKRQRFEEILYSVLEDIQKYKHDAKRLEQAYKNEKEKNEQQMKSMIEEAEHQLVIATEKIKQAERSEFDKIIENLKCQYESEIAVLQENISKMESIEKKYHESRMDEDSKIDALKNEIQSLKDEKRTLKTNLRESQTQISVLRSEIAQLRTAYNDFNRRKSSIIGSEAFDLKHEICILQETNQKLNDTNDVLLSEIVALKAKTAKHSEKQTIFANNLQQETSTPTDKTEKTESTFIPSTSALIQNSFDTDEDIDSGLWNNTAELSISRISEVDTNTSLVNSLNKELNESAQDPAMSLRVPSFSNHPAVRKKSECGVVSPMRPLKPGPPERMFKVVFAGDSAVGKSSFIMRFCKGEFTNTTSATLGVDFHMKLLEIDGKSIALQLWDTCGQERFRSIAKSYFRRADGVVLMYDCTYEKSYVNVRDWAQSIYDISEKNIPIVLIGNKTDLRGPAASGGKRVIDYEEGSRLAKEYNSFFVETSAKDGTNMDDSLIELCRIMSNNQDIELKSNSIRLALNDGKKKNCC